MYHYTPEDGAPLTPNTWEILDSLAAKLQPGREAYFNDGGDGGWRDELPEDWEFESEDWALILRELFSWNKVRQVLMCIAGSMVFLAAYYPLMRGYCWLVLAIAYVCGTDGSVWPGPYTPYPEQF